MGHRLGAIAALSHSFKPGDLPSLGKDLLGAPVVGFEHSRLTTHLRKLHALVPLVEQDAAVDGALGVSRLEEGGDTLVAQAHALELLADVGQERGPVRQRVHQPPQRHEVLWGMVGHLSRYVMKEGQGHHGS